MFGASAAAGRGQREDGQADREQPPPAEPVAERRAGQEEDRERQRVRVDRPLQTFEAGVELDPDDRQRVGDDEVVHRDHEDRDADRDPGPERSGCSAFGDPCAL